MFNLLITLIIIVAILLILIVLIQKSKGGGLMSNAGGASQIMGVQRTGDFLEKLTWGLAIALVVFTLATKPALSAQESANTGGFVSPNIEKAQQDQGIELPTTTEEVPTAPTTTDSVK